MEEEWQQYAKNNKIQTDVLEKNATKWVDVEANDAINLSVHKSINVEEKIKMIAKSLRSTLFREMKKRLSPHRHPLKNRVKDWTIYYVNLLQPGPPPSRPDDEL